VTFLAVDTAARDLADADHVVHRLDDVLAAVAPERPAYVASTHVVASPQERHLAVAAGWSGAADGAQLSAALADAFPDGAVVIDGLGSAGDAELTTTARVALEEHRSRAVGRLARFPGQAAVERRLTVAEVVAVSCVDEVVALAGVEIGPDTVVDLTGFVRPTWRDGRCLVTVQPALGGLVPFEQQHQLACCTAH
jgi:hypothetical protein